MNKKFISVQTLSDILAAGKKVARLAGNRVIKEAAVIAKVKSMREHGQLIPAIYVLAKQAIEQGLAVVDWYSGEEVTEANADDYIVIIDGQHRLEAYNRLCEELVKAGSPVFAFYLMESLNPDAAINLQLFEINTNTRVWDGPDYARSTLMMIDNPEEYPTLQFVAELTGQGYSLPSASGWATFTDKVTKAVLVNLVNGKNTKTIDILRKGKNLNRCRSIHSAAEKHFGIQFRQGRLLINWIMAQFDDTIDYDKGKFASTLVDFIETFDRKKAESIESICGVRGGETRESLVNKALDKYFDEFIMSRTSSEETEVKD